MLKESHIESFIEKVTVLEKSLGPFARFNFYEPIDFNPSDVVSIQKLGKSMAEFVGLSDLTFIINEIKKLKSTSNEQLWDIIDLDNIGIFGHSFGGGTGLVSLYNNNAM